MKRNKVALTVIAIFILGGLFLLSQRDTTDVNSPDAGGTSVLERALLSDSYATCEFIYETESATSTAYVHMGQIRIDSGGENPNTASTHMIMLGDAEYVWSDESERGLVQSGQSSIIFTTSSSTIPSGPIFSDVSRDEIIARLRTVTCVDEEIDQNRFQIPADVDFRTAESGTNGVTATSTAKNASTSTEVEQGI